MQKQTRQAPVLAQTERVQRPAQGPVAISPELLKLVAGGSPKGGWGTDPSAAAIDSPKGGW